MPSVAEVGKAPRAFLSADIDGDGRKDGFYRLYLPGHKVEFGVKLTTLNKKYFRIFEIPKNELNTLKFEVQDRKKFIDEIRCYELCSPTRIKGIALLEKSRSPEIVHVYVEEAAASAIFVNEKGKVTEEWYSD